MTREEQINEEAMMYESVARDEFRGTVESFKAGARWADENPRGTVNGKWTEGTVLAHKRIRGTFAEFRKYIDQSCEHFKADFMCCAPEFKHDDEDLKTDDWRSATLSEIDEFNRFHARFAEYMKDKNIFDFIQYSGDESWKDDVIKNTREARDKYLRAYKALKTGFFEVDETQYLVKDVISITSEHEKGNTDRTTTRMVLSLVNPLRTVHVEDEADIDLVILLFGANNTKKRWEYKAVEKTSRQSS